MRILHVHSGNIFGGVERILIALAGHHAISPGFSHSFALCFRDRLSRELAAAGAAVHELPEVRLTHPVQLMRARRSLARLARGRRFDLAVVHSAWSQAVFGRVLRGVGLPVLFWLHTRAGGDTVLERLAQMDFPDGVISVSRWVDGSAGALFPGVPSRVALSPLALDRAAFATADREGIRRALGAEPGDAVILQASRLEEWKGHRHLLPALAALPSGLKWRCWIAGGAEREEEREYLEELHGLRRLHGLEGRVQFLGNRSDVPALLSAADIYCQPNTAAEGFSIAFMEAAYAKLPIVTSALGGALEIVDATTGILTAAGDEPGLAAALERLVRDGPLRRRMGERARGRVLEQCDPKRQFSALESIFREIAQRHG